MDSKTLGCDYQGSHFGAHYEDATCIDGYLWDLDSCDEPGGPLYRGGDIPCQKCNTDECVHYYATDVFPSGNARQRRIERRKHLRDVRRRIIADVEATK